jgi:hypothetical protein
MAFARPVTFRADAHASKTSVADLLGLVTEAEVKDDVLATLDGRRRTPWRRPRSRDHAPGDLAAAWAETGW